MGVIKITIQTSTKSIRLNKDFDPNVDTVGTVKQEYCNQEDNSRTPSKMTLYRTNRALANDSATLAASGVRRSQTLTLTFKVVGGALYVPNGKNILNNKRNRKLDTTDPDVKITNKPDCILNYTDKDGVPRAEMPCGHAFVPQTMFGILKSVITKNAHEYKIICPMPNCNVEFDLDQCAAVADLNDDEYMLIQGEIAKRSAPETKACPFCKSDCERPESLKKFRVNCQACDGCDWCFICSGKWHGGGFTVCGNNSCQSAVINTVLRTCPDKKASADVTVPSIRACPKCLEFIEHDQACKHMNCKGCGENFCFACLKPYLNGKWQCGSYTNQCVVAPRQVLK